MRTKRDTVKEPARPRERARSKVLERFPVSLYYSKEGKGDERACAYGIARAYASEGLTIRTDARFEPGQRVAVRFHLPDVMPRAAFSSRGEFFGVVHRVVELPPPDPAARGAGDEMAYEAVLRWEGDVEAELNQHVPSRRRKAFLVMSVLLFSMVWSKYLNYHFFWYYPILHSYSFVIGLFFMSRFILSGMNRPPEPTEYEPTVSIVISVRNEEKYIARTIEGCFHTLYPADKREVICVNDGSTDGTAAEIARMKAKYPELRVHTLPPSGKRLGMATGVWDAHGEIIVFVDSDTFLHPLALREIVCGFEDPTLGASAGHTDVENADQNALTRMQEVRYAVGYKLMKSAESVYSCVSCCPGCLSAYRRAYLLPVLEPWLNQRFLGAKATFGDDRSLTNHILRNYRIIYNDRALCTTLVPDNWGQFMRQQVRWKKSWLRETMIASRFVIRKHPIGALSFWASALCSTMSPFVFYRAIWLALTDPHYVFAYYLLGFIVVGFSQCMFFVWKNPMHRNWLLGMYMMAIQLAVTGPQTYYAMATMRKNHWGTR